MAPTDLETTTADLLRAADRLPSPSPLPLELQGQARSGARPDALVPLLESAPNLLDRLIRLADVGRIGTGSRARGADDVCRSLGTRAVAAFALAADYADLLRSSPALDESRRRAFARRAVATAVAARSLARRGATVPEEDAFLGGLLIGVGQMALSSISPESYGPVLTEADPHLPGVDLERRRLGFDHGPIDALVLQQWLLPRSMCRAISAASAPERLAIEGTDTSTRTLCELFHTAQLAGSVAQDARPAAAFLELREALRDRYGLPSTGAVPFLRSLAPAMAEVSELLGFPSGPGLDLATLAGEVADQARTLLEESSSYSHEDEARAWVPSEVALTPDPATRLLPAADLREVLLEALARRGPDGQHLPCGLLLVGLDATRADVGDRVLGQVRQGDLAFAFDAHRVGLVTPNATPVALRALGTRLLEGLGRASDDPEPAVLRAGGAASVSVRRACEADLLLREALEALERAESTLDPGVACRVAGLR